MKSAVIITSEYLGSANNIGSHQIARQLAKKGVETFVISFPISPLYKFISKKTDYNVRKEFSQEFKKIDHNLNSYIPSVLVPPIPLLIKVCPFYLDKWELLSKDITNILPTTTFDFVFCESLFFSNLLNNITYNKLIVRLPDNFSGFWKSNLKLLEAENKLLNAADLIVTPSKLKQSDLEKILPNKKILHLPNGVNYKSYQVPYNKPTIYNDYEFTAVYVGSIADWFDIDLLKVVATKKTHWQFVIIGKAPKVSVPKNIKFIGEKTGADKVAYLQHANVGIIPFETKINKSLIDYVNPIKMYEYLAAGIPVISTQWQELMLINAPILTVHNSAEFSQHLSELENSPIQVDTFKKFAVNFDWAIITQQLLDNITDEKN